MPSDDTVNLQTAISLMSVLATQQADHAKRLSAIEDTLKRIESAPPPSAALSVDVERALGQYSDGIPRDIANGMRRRVIQRKAQGESDEQLVQYIRGGEPVGEHVEIGG